MRVQWKGEGQHPGRSEEGGRGVRRRRRCGGAGLATRRAPPHPTISIVVALLCVVCEWGATQHLSRVPAAQVTVTNPGERGLIPAQPYWPPTIPPPTRQLPTPSTPTSPKHARAHLSKIESGVRVQDHGHRKAPVGATQLTPNVEFASLRPHPLHQVFVDKPVQSIGVGWTLPEGLATQPSVVRSGHQSTTGSSNAISQETLDLNRTSNTDANGLHLLINTSSSDTLLGVRGETATSKLKSWLGEFREPAATVHSPFTNSGQFPKPKSSQENDQGNTKEGNQTLEHQRILAEQLDDGATTDPTVAITRARTASGIITVPKHNSPTPMTKLAETFPQVQDPVAPLGLAVRGMDPHLDNKAPAQLPEAFQRFNLNFPSEHLSQFNVRETNNQTSQDSQTTTVNFSPQQQGITVPTNFPLVSLRPHGGYLPLQHHVTQQSNVTNGSHSSSSKLHITTSWQPVTISPLPVNFLQSPANITQQLVPTTTLVSRPYRQFGRPAIQKQRPLHHHLVHRHHLPRHSQTQLPIIPKFRNAYRTLSHQISVIPQSSLGETSNNTHERLTQHKDSVSFPQRHNNTHLINNNHNLSYRQQAHNQSQAGLFGEVFELLNKKISKEEIARDYHYDDYYYDDYYYDYAYYEDHTGVEESTRPPSRPPIPTVHHTSTTTEPAFAPHTHFPGRLPPAQHSRPRATLGVIPTRPRFRHPITLPPSFVPPRPGSHRTVQTSKPKEPHLPSEEGRQVRPHGALRDESSFPTLPAHNHRPSHVAASLIPSERPTDLVQDPPHAEHDLPATHRGSPPTHHTINPENSLSSSSSGNISAQLLPQQENSGATTLSSLETPVSPAMTTAPVVGTNIPPHTKTLLLVPTTTMPNATKTQTEEREATASAAGKSRAPTSAPAVLYHTSTRKRPPLAVELGTFIGKGRHLTVLASPEDLLRHSGRRQETRNDKPRTPVYFPPPEARQHRSPTAGIHDLSQVAATLAQYKTRKRRHGRPENSNDQENQSKHEQSHLPVPPTLRGTSKSLENHSPARGSPSEIPMQNDISEWTRDMTVTPTPTSDRVPLQAQSLLLGYSNTSQRGTRGENTNRRNLSHPIYKESNAALPQHITEVRATAGNKKHMYPHTDHDATPGKTTRQHQNHSNDSRLTKGSRLIKDVEALTGDRSSKPPPAQSNTLPPKTTPTAHTDHRNISKWESFSRLPLLGLTGEQAVIR